VELPLCQVADGARLVALKSPAGPEAAAANAYIAAGAVAPALVAVALAAAAGVGA
jgi:hypothetical protein